MYFLHFQCIPCKGTIYLGLDIMWWFLPDFLRNVFTMDCIWFLGWKLYKKRRNFCWCVWMVVSVNVCLVFTLNEPGCSGFKTVCVIFNIFHTGNQGFTLLQHLQYLSYQWTPMPNSVFTFVITNIIQILLSKSVDYTCRTFV